jgi:hypothetical protein
LNTEILTVAELNRTARRLLEQQFPLLWVTGEISNLMRAASGHVYFSLKDAQAQVRWLSTLGCRAELWREDDGEPIVTDNGNYLARCWFAGGIPDPGALAWALAGRPGIVEHGLFLDMADTVIVAGAGGIRLLERAPSRR